MHSFVFNEMPETLEELAFRFAGISREFRFISSVINLYLCHADRNYVASFVFLIAILGIRRGFRAVRPHAARDHLHRRLQTSFAVCKHVAYVQIPMQTSRHILPDLVCRCDAIGMHRNQTDAGLYRRIIRASDPPKRRVSISLISR